jgi:phosphatidylglycerophosphate synthase
MWLTAANLLSLYRPVAALLCAYTITADAWFYAALIYLTAVVTDLADGSIARRLNQATPLGGLIDHSSDALFVVFMLGFWASQGLIPFALPLLIIFAFTQYVLDSKVLAGQSLRTNHLGRWNGIAYFALAGIPIGINWLGLPAILLDAIPWLAWLLVISTCLSILDRAQTLYRMKKS